jgi:enoyl-CoA hydratase/carnithine racemase
VTARALVNARAGAIFADVPGDVAGHAPRLRAAAQAVMKPKRQSQRIQRETRHLRTRLSPRRGLQAAVIKSSETAEVGTILLDRPERANALNRDGVAQLRSALASFSDAVELIIVRGCGGRAFCGGADAREMVALTPAERRQAIIELGMCVTELWDHPAVTVAVLDGYATGGGAHLALACDLRTASPTAWLQFPAARYGLTLGSTWLSLLTGPATAMWLLSSGRRVSADEAQLLGLVQLVVDGEHAREALGLGSGVALRELKAAMRASRPVHIDAALRAEHERAAELVGLDRFVNALRAEPSAHAA